MGTDSKTGYKRYYLSLTGENSHIIDLEPGQGSLSIGTKGVSTGEYDVWVEHGKKINWNAVNGLYTGYGLEHKADFPQGDWPRWIYYSGADTGFIEWTSKRKTEEFYWTPTEDMCVDMKEARISHLHLVLEHRVQVIMGKDIRWLSLYGNLKNLETQVYGGEHIIEFKMTGYSDSEKIYRIPDTKGLQNTESVYVEVSPLGDPFDCKSLGQFQNLKHLQIIGNICNAKTLAELKLLESLRLYSIPDLSELPPMICWEHLNSFVGVDIDEIVGRSIRKQFKAIGKEWEIDAHISGLRSKTWFATEYDNPFKEWEGKRGKKASRLYKAYLKEVKNAADEDAVKDLIIRFTEEFNSMTDIDTVEREDIYDAVERFVIASSLEILRNTWTEWFDDNRDY